LDANEAFQAGMLAAIMAKVVLVGRDWQTRALLRAQLIEEGLAIEAFETLREALAISKEAAPLPALLVVDLYSSGETRAEIERLAAWAAQIPVWIITSQSLLAEAHLKSRGFELILARPIDMGKLVEQIKRRVGP
jgi:DNA-binding NtrC family response regulator